MPGSRAAQLQTEQQMQQRCRDFRALKTPLGTLLSSSDRPCCGTFVTDLYWHSRLKPRSPVCFQVRASLVLDAFIPTSKSNKIMRLYSSCLRTFLWQDSFMGDDVIFGHYGPALPSTPFLCPAFTLPSSCWTQHSSACSELFQIISQAKNHLLFFVAGFIVLRKNLNELQSFKHNTHCFVSTIPEIWLRTILYKSTESNPLLCLILAADRLHSTAHAELLWIHIPFIIKHPIIQHLIFHLNWELHHQYLNLFQHTDKIITHWRLKNFCRV